MRVRVRVVQVPSSWDSPVSNGHWQNIDEAASRWSMPKHDGGRGSRRQRDIVSVTRRIQSAMTEAIQMCLAFHRRPHVRKDR